MLAIKWPVIQGSNAATTVFSERVERKPKRNHQSIAHFF